MVNTVLEGVGVVAAAVVVVAAAVAVAVAVVVADAVMVVAFAVAVIVVVVVVVLVLVLVMNTYISPYSNKTYPSTFRCHDTWLATYLKIDGNMSTNRWEPYSWWTKNSENSGTHCVHLMILMLLSYYHKLVSFLTSGVIKGGSRQFTIFLRWPVEASILTNQAPEKWRIDGIFYRSLQRRYCTI